MRTPQRRHPDADPRSPGPTLLPITRNATSTLPGVALPDARPGQGDLRDLRPTPICHGTVARQVGVMTGHTHPLVELAVSRDRQPSTSATPEQVEIIGELDTVGRAVAEHSRRVLMGEATDWASIADQLTSAARLCRTQVVVELTDIGDSGGR